jgi:hypothetical protein
VYAAVHELFPDKEFCMAGLSADADYEGRQEVKVSKRLGQFITNEELIDQVGQPVGVVFLR